MNAEKNVVVLSPNYVGHLNRWLPLAQHYADNGYRICFGGDKELVRFTIKNKFKLYPLKTIPITFSRCPTAYTGIKKWFFKLRERINIAVLFEQRSTELIQLLADLKPEIIFIDSFYYADFIVLYPHIEPSKIVFLGASFAKHFSPVVPPINTGASVREHSEHLWKKEFKKIKRKAFFDNIRYLGQSEQNIVATYFKKQNIPAQYALNYQRLWPHLPNNMAEWNILPKALDFKEQQLLRWQKYIHLPMPTNRVEYVSDAVKDFINTQGNNPLIYVSMGTVIHLKKVANKLSTQNFNIESLLNTFIEVAVQNPNYSFIINVDKLAIQSNAKNVLLINFAPQLYILKKAAVFCTHAGGNSILEAIHFGVPMLLLEIEGKEWAGHATRAAHHGLGIKCDHKANENTVAMNINELLKNPIYKTNLSNMANQLANDNHSQNLISYATN